jgi:hypothetical protein
MRRFVLPLLLLAVLPLRADDPSRAAMRGKTEHIINFAKLTPEQARCLAGRRYVFRLEVDDTTAIATTDCPPRALWVWQRTDGLSSIVYLPHGTKPKPGRPLIMEGLVEVGRYADSGKLCCLYLLADRVR